MKKTSSIVLSLAAMISANVFVSGCAPRVGGNDYSTKGVGEVSQTKKGTIVSLRKININAKEPNQPGVGTAAGAVGGGALGYQLGGGRGNVATTAIGALAGAAAGHFIEQKMTDQEGIEYQVQLEHGDVITVAQGLDPAMSVGQHVLVIYSGKDRSRVVPDTSGR